MRYFIRAVLAHFNIIDAKGSVVFVVIDY